MEEFKFIVNGDWTKAAWYCGMDVHKHQLAVTIYTADVKDSSCLKTAIFSVTTDGLNQFWNFVKNYRPLGFVMEATGIYHQLPYRFLMEKKTSADWRFNVIVVNPADAAGIPGRKKNDRVDSENLAKYLASGLLKNGKEIVAVLEDLKSIFRMITRIKKDTTALKNRIKKNLDRAGVRIKDFNLSSVWTCTLLYHFVRQEKSLGEFLSIALQKGFPLEPHRYIINKNMEMFKPYLQFGLTPAQRILIRQDLVELDFKTGRESLLCVEIEQLILDYPQLRRHAYNMASIPGISKVTAVWILAEIGNINQFKTARCFLSYCGCCPRVVSSADKVYSAHGSKHSNIYLRKIFYSAASNVCSVLKKDSELKQYANRIFGKKSTYSKKLAYYTVATKIAKITYAILRDGIEFNPFNLERTTGIPANERAKTFSLVERKNIRRAKNCLNRVIEMESAKNLGFLGKDAKNLLEGLEALLLKI